MARFGELLKILEISYKNGKIRNFENFENFEKKLNFGNFWNFRKNSSISVFPPGIWGFPSKNLDFNFRGPKKM